jgi:hypothetical protein
MVNPGEVLLKAVMFVQPGTEVEGADRLGPKGMWPGAGVQRSPAADGAPPAERHDLTHAGTDEERGKPVVLPRGKANRKASRWGCGYRRREQANAAR